MLSVLISPTFFKLPVKVLEPISTGVLSQFETEWNYNVPPLRNSKTQKAENFVGDLHGFEAILFKSKLLVHVEPDMIISAIRLYTNFVVKVLIQAFLSKDQRLSEHGIHVYQRYVRYLSGKNRNEIRWFRLYSIGNIIVHPIVCAVGLMENVFQQLELVLDDNMAFCYMLLVRLMKKGIWANALSRSGAEFVCPNEYCDMVLGNFFQRRVRRRSSALSGQKGLSRTIRVSKMYKPQASPLVIFLQMKLSVIVNKTRDCSVE
jgi:hypothetical protein